MFTTPNKPDYVIAEHLDTGFASNCIYNHYEHPDEFVQDILANRTAIKGTRHQELIDKGLKLYDKITDYDVTFDDKYQAVAKQVADKLVARGFTTALLYGTVEFTTEKTGVKSRQRMMLGKPDYYFKNQKMTDGKVFYDLYINLSYSYDYSDEDIRQKSYALYALCTALSKVLSIRVFVINHVKTDNGAVCYSYCIKKFRQEINPREFLYFTSDVKRTLGWAYYGLRIDNDSPGRARIGNPKNTVSIASLNLDKVIDDIWKVFNGKS